MIGWFVGWLQRLVQLGIDLAIALVRGLLRAPFTAAERAVAPTTVRPGSREEVVRIRHAVLHSGQREGAARYGGDDAHTTRHLVAEHDGRSIGAVTVRQSLMSAPPAEAEAPPAIELVGLAVLPEHRQQGVGEALLQEALRGVDAAMWCEVPASAIVFFSRRGWRAAGESGDRQRMWRPPAPPPAA